MRVVLRTALIVLITLTALALLWQFRTILLLIVIALFLTTATRPIVDKMASLRIPRFLGQLLLLGLIFLGVAAVLASLGPALGNEFQTFTNVLMIRYEMFYQTWSSGPAWQMMIAERVPQPFELVEALIGENGQLILPATLSITQNLARILGSFTIILTFSLYWAQDQAQFEKLWLSWLPVDHRRRARKIWRAVENTTGRFIRNQFVLSLIFALFSGLGLWVIGFPYPAALMLLSGAAWFIPLLGFFLILVPVLLIAWPISITMAVISGFYILLVYVVLKSVLEPRYFLQRQFSNFLIVFWVAVLSGIFGFAGFLAGPPVAVAMQVFGEKFVQSSSKREETESELMDIYQQFQATVSRYRLKEQGGSEPEIFGLVSRMEQFFEDARSQVS